VAEAAMTDVSPMSPDEYRAACEELGLSPTFGVVSLGIPLRTAGRLNRGEATATAVQANLLRTKLALKRAEERIAELEALLARHPALPAVTHS
jgi:hypothetical protein